ncbi:hypothetical protein HY441_00110 [Candidatus Microgenomates bacterium]|nr:hypothetical protein [Candidatus Microgenomates bacterium]
MAAADALESGRRSRDSKRESDVSNWVGDHALFEAWDKVTREQVRDAQRHYRRHEAGYQTQAAKEAQAAGVETDFGQRVKQPGHAAQEKDTTVAD